MRLVAIAAAGLLAGAALSAASSACHCPDDPLNELPSGRFVPTPEEAHADPGYVFELSADRQTATERFTRGGKSYVITYARGPAPSP